MGEKWGSKGRQEDRRESRGWKEEERRRRMQHRNYRDRMHKDEIKDVQTTHEKIQIAQDEESRVLAHVRQRIARRKDEKQTNRRRDGYGRGRKEQNRCW